VDAQMADGLPAELLLSLPRATIDEACRARTLVLLTGDVREELPVLFLRLRAAVRTGGTHVLELSQRPTAMTPYAAVSLRLRPGDGPAVARALVGDRALLDARGPHPEGSSFTDQELADAVGLVGDGSDMVVVVGRPSLAEHESVTAEAVRILADAFPAARFLPGLRRGNVHGALDMGMAPGLLPGRVSLEAGSQWISASWGSVPAQRGRDALGIMRSLAGEDSMPGDDDGPDGQDEVGGSRRVQRPAVRSLVLLGADPLSDFPDRALAERALTAADSVVVVASGPSPVLQHADVVLPAATAHERPGTTTNIEGRVSRLGPKLVPPGLAWPDWMVAIELADALGADLGVGSVPELWEEIRTVAPAYDGLTPGRLEAPSAGDGLLAPYSRNGSSAGAQPVDPIATPGVESVERQGAPPRVGLAEAPGMEEVRTDGTGGQVPPPMVGFDAHPPTPRGEEPSVPKPDSYSLRLTSGRRLYDRGSAVSGSPSLAALVPPAELRGNPYDLDRLGAGTGDLVRVRSPRGSLVLPAVVDPGVARGVVSVDFNLPTAASAGGAGAGAAQVENAASVLIDATTTVTDVRLESLP